MDTWLEEIEKLGQKGEIRISREWPEVRMPDEELEWAVTLTMTQDSIDHSRDVEVSSEVTLESRSSSLESAIRDVRRMVNDLHFK